MWCGSGRSNEGVTKSSNSGYVEMEDSEPIEGLMWGEEARMAAQF
jgi:hypothetical protein